MVRCSQSSGQAYYQHYYHYYQEDFYQNHGYHYPTRGGGSGRLRDHPGESAPLYAGVRKQGCFLENVLTS